jgi:hypothetical protein
MRTLEEKRYSVSNFEIFSTKYSYLIYEINNDKLLICLAIFEINFISVVFDFYWNQLVLAIRVTKKVSENTCGEEKDSNFPGLSLCREEFGVRRYV